jgi:hypothetical protein
VYGVLVGADSTRMTFVVRLLDGDGALLAWSRVPTRARLDGATALLLATSQTRFLITRSGTTARLSIEWPEMAGLARTEPVSQMAVTEGQAFDFLWLSPVWRVHGDRDAPKPAVTEGGSVTIIVPTGALAAVGQ